MISKVFFQLAKTEKLFVSQFFSDTNSFSSLARMWIRSKIERAIASMFQFWRWKPRAAARKLFIIWKSYNIVRGTVQSMAQLFKRQHGDVVVFPQGI